MKQPKGLYILRPDAYESIYSGPERNDIAELVDIYAPPQTAESIREQPELLAEAELIISGWGMPRLDKTLLAHAPHLSAIFYGAGSIRGFVTEAMWQRGIRITSAYGANAIPVSEYTLSAILFSLKHGWRFAATVRQDHRYPPREDMPGSYGSTVGLISLGMIGRIVRERLRPFDVRVIAYDPFTNAEEATRLDLTLVSLDELFATADVVSLHAPLLEETKNMITGAHFASMKPGATFINTARGAIVREEEMIAVLTERPDIQVVLDVTYPEPPVATSPLYTLFNVVLTPHIAGSLGAERRRMGRFMVDELRRYVAGQPLQWEISQEEASTMA